MILNAVRDIRSHQHVDKPATQNEVLEMVNDPFWDTATADNGPGINLKQFGMLLKKKFSAYQVTGVAVETVHVKATSKKTKQILHHDLVGIANKHHVTTLLALNFDDGIFIHSDVHMGHFSPIGGYDPLTQHVLILDVNREWTGPYWISEKTLLEGLNTLDRSTGKKKQNHRGYIRFHID